VLKRRLRDKSASSLNRMARKVNFVWNDCNDAETHTFETKWAWKDNGCLPKPWRISRPARRRNWTCRLPSSQKVCQQYVKSHKQHKKRRLCYRMLMLTGQRRESEFDLTGYVWEIPGNRAKNGCDQVVPLNAAAIAIITGLSRTRSRLAVDHRWRGSDIQSQRELDALMLEEMCRVERCTVFEQVTPCRLHDMWHRLKTWMQKARIPKDVRNAVQNHYDGGMDEQYGGTTAFGRRRGTRSTVGRRTFLV
jgi:hypothetical protein